MQRKVITEWRVKFAGVEDRFDVDEDAARAWLEHVQGDGWNDAVLLKRTVGAETSDWEPAE